MRNCFISLILLFNLLATELTGKVYTGAPFNDGMVLQSQSEVSIWGKSQPGNTITLLPSWNYKEVKVKTDNNGHWEARLETPKAGFTPYSITIRDAESTTLIRNVLIGEVWFAAGQSNMEMPLKGWKDCPVENSEKIISNANAYSGKLHFMNLPPSCAKEPQDTISAVWKDCSPASIGDFSAVAYHFACTLIDNLNVPVGIINCSYGGSNVEAWIPQDILRTYGMDLGDSVFKKLDMHTPSGLYNAMIHPLTGYVIKGFIWYQGEANVGFARNEYTKRFSDMIKSWRKEWKMGALPFYFVEIAPYNYGETLKNQAALLRISQNEVAHSVAKTGMVSTNDLVTEKEESQIHPAGKLTVGKRLANWALANDYKKSNINYLNPEYKSMCAKRGRLYLDFTQTKNGFNRQEDILGFEVCGEDSVFHPATAVVKDTQIMVYSPDVAKPVAVRYCFKNFQKGNLANKEGLPIIPFRTDKFPMK